MRQSQLTKIASSKLDGRGRDKAALIYGLMLTDHQPATESEQAHKLALSDLRTAVPDGRLPGRIRRPVADGVNNGKRANERARHPA